MNRIAAALSNSGQLLCSSARLLHMPGSSHWLARQQPIGARLASSGLSATVMPGRRRQQPSRAPLTLTPAAVERVKAALAEASAGDGGNGSGVKALRIGVRTRGCNGLSYTLEYASEKAPMDETVSQDGVTVYIDRKAQLTLLGTEMDYVKGPLVSEFVFYNPNIKGTCGCGESFNV